jgi:two-component system cell cycle sensor histidine kinase/response regulator CckA
VLLVPGAAVLLLAAQVDLPALRLMLLMAGSTLVALTGLIAAAWWLDRRGARRRRADLSCLIRDDPLPVVITDAGGVLSAVNPAACELFGLPVAARAPPSLSDLLKTRCAAPDATLAHLMAQAEARGAAKARLESAAGPLAVSVHRVDGTGYQWRITRAAPAGPFVEEATPSRSLPMLTVSASGDIIAMNEPAQRLIGPPPAKIEALFDPVDAAEKGADGGESDGTDRVIATATGPRHVRLWEVAGPDGTREIYMLPASETARRVDSAKATTDEAEEGAAFLPEDALESLPVAVLRTDQRGALLTVNRLARHLLGPRGVPGTPLASLVEGLGRPVGDWIDDALTGRGSGHPEVLRSSEPERDLYLQVSLSRVPDGSGAAGLLVVLADATELKTLEAQFVQSQKMQAIGQLAGGVAHDFNNLLTAISGHCDLLLLRHDQGDPDFADLSQIAQNANRAASLVGQLLAFSRKQNLRMEIIDLRDSLSELAHLLNRLVGERVRLRVAHDPALLTVRADKRQMEQVVMNLVVNARDAMPDGGEIRIETRMRDLDTAYSRDRVSVPAGSYVSLTVADDGSGISPDKLPKIFEPFFTTKRPGEGTGLGLSTVYGIVKQTGGYIFVDSAPGSGTTFTILLPVDTRLAPREQVMPPSPRRERLSSPGGVVLLVEDEAPVRAFASRALRMNGYTVLEAESAERALDMLEAPDLRVDVFVTDVVMPGLDGPSWVRRARETRPDVKVIFVSGYAEGVLEGLHEQIDNSVFLPKPFSLSELIETVNRQLVE